MLVDQRCHSNIDDFISEIVQLQSLIDSSNRGFVRFSYGRLTHCSCQEVEHPLWLSKTERLSRDDRQIAERSKSRETSAVWRSKAFFERILQPLKFPHH